MSCSGKWLHVDLMKINVSEERGASIFRKKPESKEER
jgi:hypothetical protein